MLVDEIAALAVQDGLPAERLPVPGIDLGGPAQGLERSLGPALEVVDDADREVGVGRSIAGRDRLLRVAHGDASVRGVEHPEIAVVLREQAERADRLRGAGEVAGDLQRLEK